MKIINKIINKLAIFKYTLSLNKLEKSIHLFYLSKKNMSFEKYSDSLKNKILNYTSSNVKYYKKISSPDLKLFPVTSKSLFQSENENDFLSRYFPLMARYRMNTGGSTGEPFHFYVGTQAGYIDNIHQECQHIKAGFTDGDKIYTINGFMPDELDIKNNKFWRERKNKKQMPFGSKEFSSHFLNKKNIKYFLDELKQNPPNFIRSYPSSMCDLTSLLIELGFESKPFNLKGIQLTSESISPQQEKAIQDYWGNIIYYQYGHSEASVIASKHPNENFYSFSPLYGHVEILDDTGNHVNQGEEGRIVVTSYHNYARPFIRYDTGDLAIYKDSDNGVVKAYKIIGRAQDYVIDKNHNELSVTALVFGQHFSAFKNIIAWQIENQEAGKLVVNIVKGQSFNSDDEFEIKTKLSFENRFNVQINYVNEIKKTVNGKHKLIVR